MRVIDRLIRIDHFPTDPFVHIDDLVEHAVHLFVFLVVLVYCEFLVHV